MAATLGNQRSSTLAIVSTHPIQYHTPWFRALASNRTCDIEVLYCHRDTPEEQSKAGFGVEFSWDVPLLEGYPYRFLKNVAPNPGLATFGGLDTPELAQLIRARRYKAVLVNGWHYKSAWQAILACWLTETPVLVRGDSHLQSPRPALKRLLKSLPYRCFIPRFDACLSVGKWSADYFAHYGADGDRVFFVPHTIDEARFSAEYNVLKAARSVLRKQWQIPESDTVFLFAGKFIPKKRPLDFVKAINAAAGIAKGITGLMVGDGPLRSACEQLALPAGNLRFAGFLNQSEMSSAYVAADVLVLPSDGDETWGLVVNEAMICERCCIVSDRVGCGPDLVIPGKTGYRFPLADASALAGLMLRCHGSAPAVADMGRRARTLMEQYSISRAVEGTLNAIAALQPARSTIHG